MSNGQKKRESKRLEPGADLFRQGGFVDAGRGTHIVPKVDVTGLMMPADDTVSPQERVARALDGFRVDGWPEGEIAPADIILGAAWFLKSCDEATDHWQAEWKLCPVCLVASCQNTVVHRDAEHLAN